MHSVALIFIFPLFCLFFPNVFKCTATLPLKKPSMTKFLFPIAPQETGIIRAMETGNASPSLSFLASLLHSPLWPSISLLLHLRCAFICIDYQVLGRKTDAYNCSWCLSVCHAYLGLLEMRLVLDFVLSGIIKLIDTEHLVQIDC